ncbi:MAG: hypothetical protein C5B50_20905 [Verrucomicrobia bacterium]|nr:MAG: hypothetical protein C5B50_20905 [Verrucomicrobiota bacterium]
MEDVFAVSIQDAQAPKVAQVSNLLYRRLPVGWPGKFWALLELAARVRIGNPRYSRLEICATFPRLYASRKTVTL